MSRSDSCLTHEEKNHSCFDAHLQGDVINLDIIGAPFAKKLNLRGLSHGRGIVPVSHWELKEKAYSSILFRYWHL